MHKKIINTLLLCVTCCPYCYFNIPVHYYMYRVCVYVCIRILECERKKKKKFHQGMSALKERLKYYELLLKRLQDIMDDRSSGIH